MNGMLFSFKKLLLLEAIRPLNEIDSGIVPEFAGEKSGMDHRLFHAEIPNSDSSKPNANLWITLLSDPENREHEFHYTTSPSVGPEDYFTAKEKIETVLGKNAIQPAFVMGHLGLLTFPKNHNYGAESLFHLFHHIRNISSEIRPGSTITFDMHTGTEEEGMEGFGNRRSDAYRKYLQRFIKNNLGQELPSSHPNIIRVKKF